MPRIVAYCGSNEGKKKNRQRGKALCVRMLLYFSKRGAKFPSRKKTGVAINSGHRVFPTSRENPFAQRMVRVGLAQESAADIWDRLIVLSRLLYEMARLIGSILIAE